MSRAAVCLVLLAVGCAGRTETVWTAQLDHVRTIPNPYNRASAMMTVAESAAMAGDADAVAEALDDLKTYPAHDDLAGRCSGRLAAVGKPREAKRIAGLIGDPGKRQDALGKLVEKPKEEEAPADVAPVGGQAAR